METKAAIIHYCQYQERCHLEVKNKLYEMGCNSQLVQEMLAMLIEMDILNEERFACSYARGKFRLKNWGKVKIKQQLKLRKISDYCIRKAMSEIDEQEYENLVSKLFNKKFEEVSNEKNVIIRKGKIFRYLIQKGFERDIVINLIDSTIKK